MSRDFVKMLSRCLFLVLFPMLLLILPRWCLMELGHNSDSLIILLNVSLEANLQHSDSILYTYPFAAFTISPMHLHSFSFLSFDIVKGECCTLVLCRINFKLFYCMSFSTIERQSPGHRKDERGTLTELLEPCIFRPSCTLCTVHAFRMSATC